MHYFSVAKAHSGNASTTFHSIAPDAWNGVLIVLKCVGLVPVANSGTARIVTTAKRTHTTKW